MERERNGNAYLNIGIQRVKVGINCEIIGITMMDIGIRDARRGNSGERYGN